VNVVNGGDKVLSKLNYLKGVWG